MVRFGKQPAVVWRALAQLGQCDIQGSFSLRMYSEQVIESYLRFLSLLEECLLSLSCLLTLLLLREVIHLAHFLQRLLIDPLQIYLRGCCDHVAGIYTSERYAIDFEGTCDEEDALGKVLEEYDALAAESASEEDED